jgi:hypothetical protein
VSKIQPIVEGYGEIEAVPVLLRRFRDESRVFGLEFGRPIRRRRSELVQEALVHKAVRLALFQPACSAILILFDADDDCPKEMGPTIERWAGAEAGDVPVAVVMPNHEYEAWFLASIESLRGKRGIRGDAPACGDPEDPRGAKEKLEELMLPGRTYSPSADQAPLTAALELPAAYQRSRSFRRMVEAFGLLAQRVGFDATGWPPAAWRPKTP